MNDIRIPNPVPHADQLTHTLPGGTGPHTLPSAHPLVDGRTTAAPLVRALRGDRPAEVPVWFMRQAGRSLPEYRAIRAETRMLDACLDPAVASEITLQPVRRHGVDAAVFFSDIVVPLLLAGVEVDLVAGRGPVFETPVRTAADVARCRAEYPAERLRAALDPVRDAVALTVSALGETPLIGFAGAPFTLAAYLVEGGPSRDHLRARTLMHAEPETWYALLDWAAELSSVFLEAQVAAGASAVQLFDSWAGSLSAADYRAHVAPASQRTLAAVQSIGTAADSGPSVPTIHFAVGSRHLLEETAALGTSALGVDWRTPLDEASQILGDRLPLQGNLDPAFLGAPDEVLRAALSDVLRRGERAPGHVLNLGHGVPPETDPAVLTRIVELAHAR
ncbi:uroporphyrinogen decarboxylase [Leucobacter luti]|uniref:uroporphyrinogen decarboxylase n=1 Tax=Leucobacter luti TaxID=340320 RepID=UPI001047089F|nr:uroporphyrinogen decarboxylase [Leucobacter luti]MCW2287280.1 uroporphyrinogen decarboxylase [Leucobacter luti]TCK41503.1 uroporphyrinogen decarboxylase [Leucobacter luti]